MNPQKKRIQLPFISMASVGPHLLSYDFYLNVEYARLVIS
jgi:hypothetical protein